MIAQPSRLPLTEATSATESSAAMCWRIRFGVQRQLSPCSTCRRDSVAIAEASERWAVRRTRSSSTFIGMPGKGSGQMLGQVAGQLLHPDADNALIGACVACWRKHGILVQYSGWTCDDSI